MYKWYLKLLRMNCSVMQKIYSVLILTKNIHFYGIRDHLK